MLSGEKEEAFPPSPNEAQITPSSFMFNQIVEIITIKSDKKHNERLENYTQAVKLCLYR